MAKRWRWKANRPKNGLRNAPRRTARWRRNGPSARLGWPTENTRSKWWPLTRSVSSIGSQGTGNGQFSDPADVGVDSSGNTWVLNWSLTAGSRLQEFNEKGEWVRSAGSQGSGAGQLLAPNAMAIDSQNNIWVADTQTNRIVEFNAKGEFVEAFGTNVNKTKVEAGGTEAEKNLCTAASGNVCQAATAGSLAGQLKTPKGIALTAGGNIWVADTGNNRLQKFSPAGAVLNTISGEGTEPGEAEGTEGGHRRP